MTFVLYIQRNALNADGQLGGGELGSASRSTLEGYLGLPSVRAALDTIAWAEGGKSYGTLFGGGTFTDYSRHPGAAGFYNAAYNTTAAGRYQIVYSTYKVLAPPLGITDFSPHSQDVLALAEASAKGGLSNIVAGNFEKALHDLGAGGRCAWASLPFTSCRGTQRSLADTMNYYRSALAVYGGTVPGVTPTWDPTPAVTPPVAGETSHGTPPPPSKPVVDNTMGWLLVGGLAFLLFS